MSVLGTDISVFRDLNFNVRSGGAVVAEALYRRLLTPHGSLFYAPDYGTDVREMLCARVTEQSLFAWKASIEQECLRDDRVDNVNADLSFNFGTGVVSIDIEAQLIDDTVTVFRLVSAQAPATATLAPDVPASSVDEIEFEFMLVMEN